MVLTEQQPKKIYLGNNELKAVYLGDTKVRPTTPPYLHFIANTAGSTVKLNKQGSPTSVTLETSTDGQNWSTYTFGNTITLVNVGDMVCFRNTSTTTTGFSTSSSNYYYFTFTGSVAGNGDINYLLNKNSTTSLPGTRCYYGLFRNCTQLTSSPNLTATTLTQNCYQYMFAGCTGLTKISTLPATTLANYCYDEMFYGCTSLEQLPNLPATTLSNYCYYAMFQGCSKIKLSSTQTGAYQTPYRIPTTGTGTDGSGSLTDMFRDTGGLWSGSPAKNTTYYTSNTVV